MIVRAVYIRRYLDSENSWRATNGNSTGNFSRRPQALLQGGYFFEFFSRPRTRPLCHFAASLRNAMHITSGGKNFFTRYDIECADTLI